MRTSIRALLVLAVVGVAVYALGEGRGSLFGTMPASEWSLSRVEAGEQEILDAFRDGRSNVWVRSGGIVERTLDDDTRGSRHQRFIVEMASGHSLLISHNIDLAPRVPLEPGDQVAFQGEYEWNARGGVLHWTHHDPDGSREGGWVRHRGETYR